MSLKSSIRYTMLLTLLGNSFLSPLVTVLAETPASDLTQETSSSSAEVPDQEQELPSSASQSEDASSEDVLDQAASSSSDTSEEEPFLTSSEEETASSSSQVAVKSEKTKPATSLQEAMEQAAAVQESRKATHVRALLPLTAAGKIQLVTTGQQVGQLALIGHDNTVTYGQPDAQNTYTVKNTQAQAQFEQLRADFAAVTYESATASLAPRIRSLEKLTMRTELTKKWGRVPSDAEVEAAVRDQYVERLDLRAAFDRVKADMDTWLLALLERSEGVDVAAIRSQKERIVLALTYLERQYSFAFGNMEAKYLLALHPEVFTGQTSSAIHRVANLGSLTYAELELGQASSTYARRLGALTQQASLVNFIDQGVALFAPGQTSAQWFVHTSKAYIIETDSQRATTSLYEKMRTDARLAKHLIALLTVSERSVYAISSMSSVTYGAIGTYVTTDPQTWTAFEAQIAKTAKEQAAFLDTWYRITEKQVELTAANILVIDTMQGYRSNNQQSASSLWSPRSGDAALLGVKEFFSPLGYYRAFLQAGAEADTAGRSFNYFMFRALSRNGQETFTHEVTHLLDKSIWFNGHSRRTGQGAEVYARGLFEIIDNTPGVSEYKPVFGLNLSYELGDNRVQNASPSRFETEADLQTYMQGVMDVLYTLDYAEAQASLNLPAEDKALLYNQMSLVADPARGANQVKDQFQTITTEQAGGLKTVEDLVDQAMVSSRLTYQGTQTTGVVKPDGYYVVSLFNPIYAALQNDAGSVGDMSLRRNAYELLAAYGYKNGMVPYLSNQHGGSDQAALAAIMGGAYGNKLTSFKKAMFKERMDKTGRLKPVAGVSDFANLQAQMQQAVTADLNQMKANKRQGLSLLNGVRAVENLKLQVYQAYLKATNDFRTSIYQDQVGEDREESQEVIPVTEEERPDDQLWEGESRVEEGRPGLRKVVKVWRTVNGQREGEPQITTTTLQEMTPTIRYKGTKLRYSQITTVRHEEIAITDEQLTDAALWEGESRTEPGKVGQKRITTVQPTDKGVPVGQAKVTEEVITKMVPRKIYKGTKPRYSQITTVRHEEIAITDEQLTDVALWEGESRTEPGKVGQKRITTVQPTDKGVPVGQAKVTEEVITKMVPRKIYKGIKPIAGQIVRTEEVEIPIEEEVLEDANLPKGQERIEEGQVGRKKITRIQPTEKGQPKGPEEIKEEIITKMVPRKIYKGTKEEPDQKEPPKEQPAKPVYRLYNRQKDVYFYTVHISETKLLQERGWQYEGVAWKTAVDQGGPVYRLYDPQTKLYFYTRHESEYNLLAQRGWRKEGTAYRSYGTVAIYRLYHPKTKTYVYTRHESEKVAFQKKGWRYEGIAWHSLP